MAIFNEAYITEFFGLGKKKKKENKKKYGLITKEEYQKCKSIITSICSKFKIIKENIDFNPESEYNNYCKDGTSSFTIAEITYEKDYWDDADYGVQERKSKGFPEDYEKFMDWYRDQLSEFQKELDKAFKKEFDSNIRVYMDGCSDCDYIIIESKKPKEEDEDNSKDDNK